jgi:hypothetical protein
VLHPEVELKRQVIEFEPPGSLKFGDMPKSVSSIAKTANTSETMSSVNLLAAQR